MPILLDGNKINKFEELRNIYSKKLSIKLQDTSDELKNSEIKVIGPNDFSLYVHQQEFATLKPGESFIKTIGTDEATTCHILIFRHTGSGVVSLAHLDGSYTKDFIRAMLKSMEKLTVGSPEGSLEMHLIGGFLDSRNLSSKLTEEIINSVLKFDAPVHLVTYCTAVDNNIVKDGIHYPQLTGIGIDINTGKIFPMESTTKGPDNDIRSAGCSVCPLSKVKSVFENGCLEVGPYYWTFNGQECWPIDEDDDYIKKNFSTSPEQESKYFAGHMRAMFRVLREHPNSVSMLFRGGVPRKYKLDGSRGCWERIF